MSPCPTLLVRSHPICSKGKEQQPLFTIPTSLSSIGGFLLPPSLPLFSRLGAQPLAVFGRVGGGGDGILGLGWPAGAAAPAKLPNAGGAAPVAEGSSTVAAAAPQRRREELEGEEEKQKRNLDPRRTHYLPIRTNPNEGERDEDASEEVERGQREAQEASAQGLQLHPIFQQVQELPPQTSRRRSYSYSFSSSAAATASSSDYARLSERLGEDPGLGYLHQPSLQPHSRYGRGVRGGGGGGEIVEVQGGHIVRSIGRKDRHSKVCTAKGPRDRRVRLSAHTAIQFYDVQDRLGYDRPSKAVDWLIKNAKTAIDELAELPAWIPTATVAATSSRPALSPANQLPAAAELPMGEPSKNHVPVAEPVASAAFSYGGGGSGGSISFLPPSLDSDAIADTIKSFFPMAATAASPSSSPTIAFQNYPPDLMSRTSSHNQDLRLSLQSFQDPTFHNPQSSHHHHHHGGQSHENPATSAHNALFSSPGHLAFDSASASWAEQSQRMAPWNVAEAAAVAGGGGVAGGGYMFSVPPQQAVSLHSALGQSLLFSQRGPLQSSYLPSFRAWADSGLASADHQMHPAAAALHPSMSSIGFASGIGFSGFRIPARIQGEEEHDGISDQPPSASSASHH